jgi:serine/threonine protein kinase/WD40 repeat protein
MNAPDEAQWDRVEALADEISGLPPEQVTHRLSELAASGESTTVLTLLGTWLDLPPPPAPFSSGTTLAGRYVLREKLGEGGMGSVWRARQELIGRDVALKIIHPPLVTSSLRARFVGEMEILGQLNHPGIVRIFDAGIHQMPEGSSIPFFAMELIAGQPLDQWAAAHRERRAELLRVASEICVALSSAHEREIVHRDLKPRNILVRIGGQPIVLDFGIARLRGLVLGEEEGMFSGTPQYSAPEQHLGRDHDFRSGESVDIYAVGTILFEMLSGRKLFEFNRGASLSEMRRVVLESKNPRLSEVVSNCPLVLEEIVSKAVRRDPADRFYSIAALGRAIDRVAKLIVSPEAPPAPWSPGPRATVPGTNWVLLEKIGEGGAGEVWVGAHKQLEERRVFKFCDTEEKARTLKREVTLFRLLKERVGRNPHFITLHEVSLDEPPLYLMMDFVDARDLESWCGAYPGGLAAIPENLRIEIVIQAAEALQAAHEAGILHRDIKPANLLVREDSPNRLHVLVADFGIGQIVTDQLLRDSTRLGFTRTVSELRRDHLSGTLLYLAPEVLEGSPASARSDIYSLGVVLWQLLAGNLHAALDPADWPSRISDPILKEFLHRCLAGLPEKRWTCAGDLAASLRALPQRRAAEEQRRAEIAARERVAYRRGIMRAAGIAVAIIGLITALAILAVVQRRAAERAEGEIALEQAESLSSRLTMGRRERGLELLETAAKTGTNLPALRTAAAAVFGLADLVKVAPPENSNGRSPLSSIPKQPGEECRSLSNDGAVLAIARSIDGLNGAIDLIDSNSGKPKLCITRKDFPWVPIAEAGLLRFSPDDRYLAVGGAATSRHVLLLNTTNGAVRAYLFHGSDPLSCAWHPGGRLFATGCADGTIRIWDLSAAASPKQNATTGNQFDLPPALDVPALDTPLYVFQGQRGPVEHLVFGTRGNWLAALDHTGYLRILSGFSSGRFSQASSSSGTKEFLTSRPWAPALAVEVRIDHVEQVSGLSAQMDSVIIDRDSGSRERFRFFAGELPDELQLEPDLAQIAWGGGGQDLCVITLTDAYWLRSSPLELFFHAVGNNPVAASWNSKQAAWFLTAEDRLDAFQLVMKDGASHLERSSSFTLTEAVKGQGARTSLASADNGRSAVYRGRRIQFFSNNTAAPLASSIIADGGGGSFQEIIWDTTGRLLGVLFKQSSGLMRLESWKTSLDFPPRCDSLPTASLECERAVAANDGQNYFARSVRRGLFRFDPATGTQLALDNSSPARQDGAMACSENGAFLAMVVDGNLIRLLRMPGGVLFAELRNPRASAISLLRWDDSGSRLGGLTEDGCVQVWNLAPWRQWLTAHHMDK